VVFAPSGLRGRFADGVTILEAARSLGVDLDSVCGGRGICGRCQIEVAEGEQAKLGIYSEASHLTPWTGIERAYAERRTMKPDRRLGCSAAICGDLVIDVPAESQVHRQVVRKAAEARTIEIDPVVRLYYLEVRQPDMADPSSDLRRLLEALHREWGVSGVEVDPQVLVGLQQTLREGKWTVTAAVHDGSDLTALWPGFHDVALGVAVDIGSTTIAGHLCDLHTGEVLASAGVMNPQIRFGEDLMSRVSYVMMHPGSQAELTAVVRESVDGLIGTLCDGAGAERTDVLELTIVGNPIMHHLFLGLDPTELGGAPFALATDQSVRRTAADLDLSVHPGARLYVLPCIAGHVGADAAAVILAEEPHRRDEISLLVDVGTNAEIVLGNRHRLLAASSPTGPAFEGAQISAGQRAAPGAIERVRIDPETLEPRFRVIGTDVWSNEPEFAGTPVTGICGSGIVEVIAEMRAAGIVGQDGVVDGRLAERTHRVFADGRTFSYRLHEAIVVTQNDVRQIQLAKAALAAGARLLMDHYGIDRVDRVRLAGAFGSQLDPAHTVALGMVPETPVELVSSAGNAAGTGARIALLNRAARKEIEDVVRQVVKIETAVEPRFQEHFVYAMGIPFGTTGEQLRRRRRST
jgi:uncharacterized 2Fe-2S/4Fe-4S cluster protein (DUF4445 family)